MNRLIKKITNFFNKDIWDADNESLYPLQKQLYKQLRIIFIATKRYVKQEGNLSASALTFFTLLSIVPVLAMAFGVAKGFGIDGILEEQIRENLYGQGEVVEKLIEFSRSMLENTNGGIVAGIGFVIVFYSVLKLLNFIEDAFNKAWDIDTPRPFYRKFTDYTSFVVIAPVLFVISSSISVFVISGVESATDNINMFGVLDTAITFSLEFVSFALIWLLMIMIYMLLPNTNVSWKAAIQSGIVIGSLFIITQWIYVNFQIGAARANAIYGSFAALPLFLVWLQVSWFIVVFGATYTYAIQNEKLHRQKFSSEKLNEYNLKKLALLIAHFIVKDFSEAKTPTKEGEIAERLQVPIKVVHEILNMLLKSKIIVEVLNGSERSFHPAMDINKLTISHVLNMLEDRRAVHWDFNHIEGSKKIDEILIMFREITANEKSNILLANL